ncbi:hypothetical protein RUND412_007902 [Rhizina undulata]
MHSTVTVGYSVVNVSQTDTDMETETVSYTARRAISGSRALSRRRAISYSWSATPESFQTLAQREWRTQVPRIVDVEEEDKAQSGNRHIDRRKAIRRSQDLRRQRLERRRATRIKYIDGRKSRSESGMETNMTLEKQKRDKKKAKNKKKKKKKTLGERLLGLLRGLGGALSAVVYIQPTFKPKHLNDAPAKLRRDGSRRSTHTRSSSRHC